MGKTGELKAEQDSLVKDINRSRFILNQEVFGDKTNQTSGINGYGTYAKQKQEVLAQKEERLGYVRAELGKMDAFINRRKEMDGLASERMFNSKQLDSLSNVAGFADRNWALGQLSFKANGERDLDTYLAISFIGFLFILFECLPVFVKLMSNLGPYDVDLQNSEYAAMHGSYKGKDFNIAVIDGIQDTKVDTEINKQKRLISGRSNRELENHPWD